MLVSKSRFLDFIRCNRFPAFEMLYRFGSDSLVTTDPNSFDAIYSEETQNKKSYLRSMMFERPEHYQENEEDEDDVVDLINPKVESPFDDDFVEIEKIAARVLKNRFKAPVVASDKLWDQKHFEAEHGGYKFHCFLDAYIETEKEIMVVEVKASTDRKFMERGGVTNPLFIRHVDDITYRKSDLGISHKPIKDPFKNPFSDIGRMSYDIAFQRFVIDKHQEQKGSFKKPVRYLLAVLNHEYVYDGKTNAEGKPVYSDDIISLIEYTNITEELQPELIVYADRVVDRLNNSDISPVPMGNFCLRKKIRECPYYHICSSDKHIPEKNSILNYLYNHHGFLMDEQKKDKTYPFELIDEGKVHMLDLELNNLPNERQKVQWEVVSSKNEYVDKININDGLKMIKYPIYHLDFETFASPLPRFAGEKCFTQSVFQYSLHIEREPGVCDKDKDHFEFLVKNSIVDQRKELYDSLMSHITDPNGMILAYNVSFEKGRLKELNNLFPEHEKIISPLIEDAFDLMDLLKGRKALFDEKKAPKQLLYYHEDLNGSYSIKKVLPIFAPELSYQDLVVQKGTDAVLDFSKLKNLSKEDYDKSYQALLAYCKLDTWAMVRVLDELRKKVQ